MDGIEKRLAWEPTLEEFIKLLVICRREGISISTQSFGYWSFYRVYGELSRHVTIDHNLGITYGTQKGPGEKVTLVWVNKKQALSMLGIEEEEFNRPETRKENP